MLGFRMVLVELVVAEVPCCPCQPRFCDKGAGDKGGRVTLSERHLFAVFKASWYSIDRLGQS